MKYLGIDFGTKWIGLSISDEAGMIAFPRASIANDEKALPFIERLVREEGITNAIVGDTRALTGKENTITAQAEAFFDLLRKKVAVTSVSEAWTSFEAARYAPPGKTHDNAAAAAIILQRYLDMHGTERVE